MIERVHVLLVEDHPGDARLIREMLQHAQYFGVVYQLSRTETLRSAEEHVAGENFDVILLDLQLPDSSGLDTLTALYEVCPGIPIIVLTGSSDHQLALQAVNCGAQDYIPKEECNTQLLTRIIHFAIERKQVEERLRYLAMHDDLTGLPNRALLYDRLARAIQRSRRKMQETNIKWKIAIMMVDLDTFKMVNDNYGHDAGDILLQQVARRLESCLRQTDTVGRWGGDEFLIVLEGVQERADCEAVAEKILLALHSPPLLPPESSPVSASVGLSLFPDDAEDFNALLRTADQTMYEVKNRSRGQARYRAAQ